jgi:hypothetical protein
MLLLRLNRKLMVIDIRGSQRPALKIIKDRCASRLIEQEDPSFQTSKG